MNELIFETELGQLIPTDASGSKAILTGEFVPWVVRWLDGRDAPIYTRMGSGVCQLEWKNGHYVIPVRRKKDKPLNVRFAGDVSLFADPGCSVMLLPWLRVNPTNLEQGQYRSLLDDLGALAWSMSAYLMPGRRPDGAGIGGAPSPLAAWLGMAAAAERMLQVLHEQLPRIAANPSRTMKRTARAIDRASAVRHGKGRLVDHWPEHRRRGIAPLLDYSDESPERAFVDAVRSWVTREAAALTRVIERRLGFQEAGQAEAEDATRRWNLAARPTGERRPATTRDVEQLLNRLRGLSSELGRTDRSSAMSDVLTVRTNRLLMSPEYQPVVRAWDAYRAEVALDTRTAGLLARLDEQSVAPTTDLYERWVTVKIYSALVERGFRPPQGEPSLLDRIDVDDAQRLSLDGDNSPLRLIRQCQGSRVELTVRHEPTVEVAGQTRRPDLVIDARTPAKRETWVFDAKYKNYLLEAPSYQREPALLYGSHFAADLFGVAEVKYRRLMGADFSAIIHPDPSIDFTTWDPEMGARGGPEPCTAAAPHALASVALSPGPLGDAHLTKMLRLLLGYRLGLVSTCWRCGIEGTPRDVPGSKGDGYACPGCSSFWIVHWCKACGHRPLLKFGRASFHRVELHDSFNVHCPRCGDFFVGAPVRGHVPRAIDVDEELF
jgi:hypothetical protein